MIDQQTLFTTVWLQDVVNTEADDFMHQQFLAKDPRINLDNISFSSIVPSHNGGLWSALTEFYKKTDYFLQLTGGVTASPLTCSLTVQKTILYFQRPFLTCWCFLKQNKQKPNKQNLLLCKKILKWSICKNQISSNLACTDFNLNKKNKT